MTLVRPPFTPFSSEVSIAANPARILEDHNQEFRKMYSRASIDLMKIDPTKILPDLPEESVLEGYLSLMIVFKKAINQNLEPDKLRKEMARIGKVGIKIAKSIEEFSKILKLAKSFEEMSKMIDSHKGQFLGSAKNE